MAFDFSTLVTDRTQADVAAGNAKGTYNAADLNRVDAAVSDIAERFASYGYAAFGYRKIEIIRPGIKTVTTETKLVDETITENNVDSFFSVANGTYYFAPKDGVWTSNNSGVKSSTATTTFTAKSSMPVSFDYSYSSEAKYDKFTLVVAGTTVEDGVSGATTLKSYSGNLTAGQIISLTYSKDSSNDSNDDKCTLSNFKAKVEKTVEVIVITPDPRDHYTWYEDDVPTASQMKTYRGNIASLRAVIAVMASTPKAPEAMRALNYVKANNIELILEDLDQLIINMTQAWFFSGDLYAGET